MYKTTTLAPTIKIINRDDEENSGIVGFCVRAGVDVVDVVSGRTVN
jgi:hypothetical protein